MVIEKKHNDEGTYDITIEKENKKLRIFQTGLDYTITCQYVDYVRITDIDFEILEEESVYPFFNELYENIVLGNCLGEKNITKETLERMNGMINSSIYKEIVKDGVITILCDAYPVTCPNILKIQKLDGKILLSFTKVQGNMMPKRKDAISIHIRQSGSRIGEFGYPFKYLFQDLQSIQEIKEEATLKLKKD